MKDENYINDKWLKLFSIPIISLVAAFVLSRNFAGVIDEAPWKNLLVNFILVYSGWELNTWISKEAKKKFPGIEKTQQRIVTVFLAYAVADMALTTLIVLITKLIHYYEHYDCTWNDYWLLITMVVMSSWIIGGMYEAIYFFSLWKKAAEERESFRNESLQAQLNALKSRVNPHFLFNSLNSLSSLIDDNTEQAKLYVQEMSQVYRYILQSSERETVSLKEEMEFIGAYFFLLRTKHGDNLSHEIRINEDALNMSLPPLSIQMLVENAVKHNIVSSAKPLIIKIYNLNKDAVIVENNLQKRNEIVPSNKVGLSNIQKRYEILGANGMKVEQVNNKFAVTVPLIEANALTTVNDASAK